MRLTVLTQPRHATRRTYRLALGDLTLSAGLFALALALRLPQLLVSPHLTDETRDVLWGWDIYLGLHLPLTSWDAYKGPFFPYLMAALFKVLGPSLLWPRLTAAIAGAALVVVTYWLGRRMGNRLVGLVAASLTLTNPTHVVFASHYAWPDAFNGVLVLATLTLLWAGVTYQRGALIAATGLGAALALQVHPANAVPLAGGVIWFLCHTDGRTWLRRPVPYLAVGLLLLGYTPMLVAFTRSDNLLVEHTVGRTYAFSLVASPLDYLDRVWSLVKYIMYVVGGILPPPTLDTRLTEVIILCLLIPGLIVAWRRGVRLIHAVFLATIVAFPLFMHGPSARYFAVLPPLAYIAIGLLASAVVKAGDPRRGWTRAALVGLLWASLTLYPLVTIARHYRLNHTTGYTNLEVYRLSDLLHASGRCGPHLYIAREGTANDGTDPEHYFVMEAVNYVLTLTGCAHHFVPLSAIPSASPPSAAQSLILLVDSPAALAFGQPPDFTFLLPHAEHGLIRVGLYTQSPARADSP